jgi:ferricrocin synthase
VLAQPSIDIEAAIRNGALDVGIFAPGDILGQEQAEGVMESLRDLLESVATDG